MTPEERLLTSWDGKQERRRDNRNQLFDMIAELDAKMDKMLSALPDGDADGHRQYHEAVMHALARREKFMDAIIEKSLAALIWSSLSVVGYSLWGYIKDHLK